MKHRLLVTSLLCLTLAGASLQASTLYWSANGTTLGGAGTWNTTAAHWGTDTSGPFTTVWNNANTDDAVLSAGAGATPGGAIALGADITMNGTLTWQQTPGTYPSYTLNSSATMTFSPGSVLSCNNDMGGGLGVGSFSAKYAGTITKSGTAQLEFNNANGSVTKFIFKQGTASFASPNRFGTANAAADFLTFEGGVMRPNTTTAWTMGRSITVNTGGGTLAASSATITITLDKPISYLANVTFRVITTPLHLASTGNSGTGTLSLGTTTTCDAANVIGSGIHLSVNGGSLTMTAGNQSARSLSSSGNINLGARILTLNNTSSQTYSGVISGTGGLVQNGTSIQILSGNNTYSGTTTINAGTLTFSGASTCTGTTTVNPGGTLRISTSGTAFPSSPIVLAGGGTLDVDSLSATIAALSGSGNISNNVGQTLTVNGDLSLGQVYNQYSCFSGAITNGSLTKDGTGAMALRGSNTFEGALTLNNGTLSVGAAPDRLPPTITLSPNAPAIFQLDASLQTVGSLGGNGFVNLGGGTLVDNDTGNTFSGVIQNSELPGSSTAVGHGLRGYYYNNIDLTALTTVRDDATVNLPNMSAWPGYVAGVTKTNQVSARWLGQVLTTAAGSYRFTVTCDDGQRLWVNGALLVDDWALHGATAKSGDITLAANTKYDIVMEFFNNTSGGSALLSWTPPSDTTTNVIPTQYLFLPGAGALVMNGGGSLTLGNANSYSGDTMVLAGSLIAQADGALGNGNVTVSNANLTLQFGATNGYMSPAASLLLNGGSPTVTLTYSGTEDIRALSYNGGTTYQVAGIYGALGSGAAHEDGRFSGSGFLRVTGAPTTTGLTSSGSPTAVYGASLTLTATVAPSSPTGTVSFYDGALWLGSSTLNGAGVATLSVNHLSVTASPHSLKAVYSGDATHAPSTSAAVSQSTTVATLTPTVVIATKFYDGTTNATIGSASFSGIVPEDTNFVSIVGTAVANFLDKNVGVGKTVNVTGLALTGSLSANYTMPTTSLTTTGTITNKSVYVTGITATNKVYDATTADGYTGTPALAGVISPEVVNLTGTGTLNFNTKNIGTAKPVTVTGFGINGADSSNYVLVQTNLSANITTFPITVGGLTVNSKVYDGTTNATLSGTAVLSPSPFGGDTVTLGGTPVAGFNNKNAGVSKPVIVSGYTISGTDATNYALAQPSLTGTITADGTTAVILSSLNPSTLTSNVTFTATISGVTAAADSPTGNVVFTTNTVLAAVVALTATTPGVATATFSTAALPVGAHNVQVQYAGDGNFGASGDALTQTVNAATSPFKITSIVPGVGIMTITYSNAVGSKIVLVQSANPAATLSTWSRIATNVTPNGTFTPATSGGQQNWRILGEP